MYLWYSGLAQSQEKHTWIVSQGGLIIIPGERYPLGFIFISMVLTQLAQDLPEVEICHLCAYFFKPITKLQENDFMMVDRGAIFDIFDIFDFYLSIQYV